MTDDVGPGGASRLQDSLNLVFEFTRTADERPVPIDIRVVNAETLGLEEGPDIPEVVELVLITVIDLEKVVGEHIKTCYSVGENNRIG